MTDTQKAIREAYVALAERHSLPDITIKAVCSTAGISRRTFSRHYGSLEEVISDQIREDAVEPSRALLDLLPARLLDEDNGAVILEKVYQTFDAKKGFYRSVIRNYGAAWFASTYVSVTSSFALSDMSSMDISPLDGSYARFFFPTVNAFSLSWWLTQDNPCNPEELARLTLSWGYAHWRELGA